jgi:hypothetical protein
MNDGACWIGHGGTVKSEKWGEVWNSERRVWIW